MNYTTEHVHYHSTNEFITGCDETIIMSPTVDALTAEALNDRKTFKAFRAALFKERNAWEINAGERNGKTLVRIIHCLRGGSPSQRVIWYWIGESLTAEQKKKIVAQLANSLDHILSTFENKKKVTARDVFNILSDYDICLADHIVCPEYHDFNKEEKHFRKF